MLFSVSEMTNFLFDGRPRLSDQVTLGLMNGVAELSRVIRRYEKSLKSEDMAWKPVSMRFFRH